MRLNRLAFLFSILAGILCLGIFFYKVVTHHDRDFTILVIGIFMIALGGSSFYKSRRKNQI